MCVVKVVIAADIIEMLNVFPSHSSFNFIGLHSIVSMIPSFFSLTMLLLRLNPTVNPMIKGMYGMNVFIRYVGFSLVVNRKIPVNSSVLNSDVPKLLSLIASINSFLIRVDMCFIFATSYNLKIDVVEAFFTSFYIGDF